MDYPCFDVPRSLFEYAESLREFDLMISQDAIAVDLWIIADKKGRSIGKLWEYSAPPETPHGVKLFVAPGKMRDAVTTAFKALGMRELGIANS